MPPETVVVVVIVIVVVVVIVVVGVVVVVVVNTNKCILQDWDTWRNWFVTWDCRCRCHCCCSCHYGCWSLLLLLLSIQTTNMSYRIGTCGGIGLPPGTVVVTEEAVDGRLRPFLDTVCLQSLSPSSISCPMIQKKADFVIHCKFSAAPDHPRASGVPPCEA